MKLRVFKHKMGREYYLIRGDEERFIYWDYTSRTWQCSITDTWEEIPTSYGVREVSWLELLVSTGTSKKEAQKAWIGLTL